MWIKDFPGRSIAIGACLVAGLAIGAQAHAQSGGCGTAAAETNGSVQFQVGNDAPQGVKQGTQIAVGAVVTTARDAAVVLKFSDGQIVVLGENTRFRIVSCRYDPQEMKQSGVFLNLIEGSARLVMGAIGQFDPALVRIQVGTGTVAGMQSPDGTRGGDAGVSVQGAVTLLSVTQGQVSLTLPSGQSFQVPAGQEVLVQADGTARQGTPAQISALAGQTSDGRQMVAQLDELQSYAFAQRNQQTVITLVTASTQPSAPATTSPGTAPATSGESAPSAATPPGTAPPSDGAPPPSAPPPVAEAPPDLDLPPPGEPLTLPPTLGTPPTGAGGGGAPCGASCN